MRRLSQEPCADPARNPRNPASIRITRARTTTGALWGGYISRQGHGTCRVARCISCASSCWMGVCSSRTRPSGARASLHGTRSLLRGGAGPSPYFPKAFARLPFTRRHDPGNDFATNINNLYDTVQPVSTTSMTPYSLAFPSFLRAYRSWGSRCEKARFEWRHPLWYSTSNSGAPRAHEVRGQWRCGRRAVG